MLQCVCKDFSLTSGPPLGQHFQKCAPTQNPPKNTINEVKKKNPSESQRSGEVTRTG